MCCVIDRGRSFKGRVQRSLVEGTPYPGEVGGARMGWGPIHGESHRKHTEDVGMPVATLLSQWLTYFKLLGIPYLVGKIKFKLFFQGPLAK